MMPEAKKMIRVTLWLFIILRVREWLHCRCNSHVQYSSKDPCCSLAFGHRRISRRRFSPRELGVEGSDDRKYVCVRRLAVLKRHNFCSSSSSLATSITCNHFLRLVDTRASQQTLIWIVLRARSKQLPCGDDASYLISFPFFSCLYVCIFFKIIATLSNWTFVHFKCG